MEPQEFHHREPRERIFSLGLSGNAPLPLPLDGGVGVIMVENFKGFRFDPPHPAPLPQGEREFPDEN